MKTNTLAKGLSVFVIFIFAACHNTDQKNSADIMGMLDSSKAQKMTVSPVGDTFSKRINQVVDAYLELKDAFVEGEMSLVKSKCTAFISVVKSMDDNELKKDTSVYVILKGPLDDLLSNAASLNKQSNIIEMRRDFSGLSESLYPLLRTIHYEGPTLYFQNCPMAFNDEEPANWITNSPKIMNPYLGKNHPKYKAGMLNCGEIRDSITSSH